MGRRFAWLLVLALVAAGCAGANATLCDDGTLCPAGNTCRTVTTHGGPRAVCATAAQLEACAAGQTTCSDGTGTCHDGVCLPDACGNGLRDTDEMCDDGNTTGGDGCAADCKSDEMCGNHAVDPIVGETCDDGSNLVEHDGCSTTCQRETLRWTQLQPAARFYGAAAYDSRRHRVVSFGGFDQTQTVSRDTWEWDGRRWTRRLLDVAPSGRSRHALAYDAARGETILFGGDGEGSVTWALGDAGWAAKTPAHSPSARIGHTMAYDARGKRVVLFGGRTYGGAGPLDDTWTWDGTDWAELASPTRPTASASAAMAYDARRGVIVLYDESKTFELGATGWVERVVATPTFSNGYAPAAAFDSVNNEVLLAGGYITGSYRQTWGWNGTQWTRRADLPLDAVGHRLVGDAGRGRVVLALSQGGGPDGTDAVYEWDGATWTAAVHTAAAPDARPNAALAADATHHELLLFGGGSGPELGDTWTWDGGWHQHAVTGPSARAGATMTYDPAHDTIVLFGGNDGGGSLRGDTWLWKDHQWSQPPNPGTPPGRWLSTMAFDYQSGHVVMFGGSGDSGLLYDTWSWDGAKWTPLTGAHPSARRAVALGYDVAGGKLTLFGGELDDGSTQYQDTWVLDGEAWTQVAQGAPSVPAGRAAGQLIWDGAARQLLLVGGRIYGGGFATVASELWRWDGAWHLSPSAVDPPASPLLVAPDLDASGAMMVASSDGTAFDRVWRLRYEGGSADELCTSADTDGDGAVGCADPDCAARCMPACPAGLAPTLCPAGPRCGDGVCNPALESCDLCPADCGACPARCGDGSCGAGESAATCAGDCP